MLARSSILLSGRSSASLGQRAFAKVTLQGRLVDAPTTFESKNGTIFARYTVAVDNRSTYNKEEKTASFFDVTAFGKQYEHLGTEFDNLQKGTLVEVEASLERVKHEDPQANYMPSRYVPRSGRPVQVYRYNMTQNDLKVLGQPASAQSQGEEGMHSEQEHDK